MRNIPYIQEIIVTEDNLPSIKKVLQEVDNRYNPYLINVLELDGPLPVMSSIQKYLELKISDFNFPYPIYFLSKQVLKGSPITTFQRQIDIPKFYFRKEKRPTRIHTQISRLNISAEKKLEYDNREESYKKVQKYARDNKEIHLLNLKNQYYQKLLKNTKTANAQKRSKTESA